MGALDAANWEKYYPKDLIINPTSEILSANTATDKNNFTVVVPNLKIDSNYSFQFQYVFEDGVKSDWSPGKFVNTSTETVPSAPTATVTGGAGFIKVELPTFPANALRVDVRIAGGTFGSGTVVAESFTSAGVKTIAALGAASPGNAYVVTLLTVTPSKINGDPSSPVTVYVTDPSAALVVTSPQDPFAPTVRSGLASVIVEWSGKKSDGTDLTLTGFSGARVHIGTSSGFTPSADNWVHTLNFANGSNRVSIGVGSIIDKSNSSTLQYGTAYYVKLVAVNASGTASSAVSASNNPVTVAKLPASEISTGILTADASITAGVSGGQRVVVSGSVAPLIIYGTDGTTKLLEYVTSGTTGSLAIKGSGTFSGDISAASGTFTGNVTTSGNISASNGNFTVNNGVLTALDGTIGGWTINGSILQSTANNSGQIKFEPITANGGKIALFYGGVEKITIDAVEGIVGPSVTVAGNTGSAFKITPTGTAEFRGTIYASNGIFSGTVSGATIQTSNTSYIRMDAASPSEIQLHANGFTYDGTIDFGGGTSNDKPFGSLVIQSPSNAPYHKPSLSLDDSSGISLESYNKIYFSVSRPVSGTNNTSELNVFAYMEQYGSQGAYQGRFNFEANIPVADKSFRPIFAGTTSDPSAYFPNEEIGSIYLEY